MKKIYLTFAFLGLLAAVSCIEEDLDACPEEGGPVAVTLRAEKFQARPPYAPSDLEENFAARIRSLDYLLYADGRLVDEGNLDGQLTGDGGSYVFRHEPLPFGTYRLAFVANTPAHVMAGSKDAPEHWFIVYEGEKGNDHFRTDLTFEVSCPVRNEFEAVMRRVYGVTRFRFENIPAEIEAVEVSLDHVGERIPVSGAPDRACEVSKRVQVAEMAASGAFTLGTFPTLPGERSTWRLKLYGEDAARPLYDRIVTDTLRIESNQLLDLKVRFREDEFLEDIEFTVDVDTAWDGSNDGGGGTVVVQ